MYVLPCPICCGEFGYGYATEGYNVLFPMGFHYTGTPVLGMAKRIQAGEKEILDGLRNIYHVPEDAIKTFVEPIKIADY